ncbi:MAG: phage BR0599 family protein [Candidatus Omnitrophica bacterium]|nr:phage BR0599 family protein [Candidatus Omnitrophota bacterium]
MAYALPAALVTEKGKPQVEVAELFDFILDTQTLKFTSYTRDVSFYDLTGAAATYTAIPIAREGADTNLDMRADAIRIAVDNVTKAMSSYIANNEFRGRRLVIRRVFTNLLSAPTYYQPVFDGVMDRPLIGNTRAQIEAVSRLGFLARLGPRRMYQLRCNWRFAVAPPDSGCANGIAAATLKDTRTAQTVDSGSTPTVIQDAARAEAANYWKIGIATFTGGTAANVGQKRRVVASAVGSFTVDVALPAAPAAGDAYDLERDCDLSFEDCRDRFANTQNFGGFPSIPMELVYKG